MSKLNRPSVALLDRYVGNDFLPLYRGTVTVVGGEAGHGRASGVARSSDKALDLQLRLPRELGGNGGGTNPEQLLAAGYAACFHGALNLIAANRKLTIKDTEVTAHVTFGRDPDDGLFALTVDLQVKIPDLDRLQAADLVHETELVCPYAKIGRKGFTGRIEIV